MRMAILVVLAIAVLLAMGFQAGRDFERVLAQSAECMAQSDCRPKRISKAAAWNKVYGRPHSPREDLGLPGIRAER